MHFIEENKKYFFVIQQLALRDKRRENNSAILGQLWQIINPFINMMVLILIFSTMFKNKDFVNYPMFVATGTTIFELFNFGTKNCQGALVGNKNYLIRTQIPKNVFIMERVYVALINFMLSSVVYIGMMIFEGIPFRWTDLLVIFDVAIFLFLIVGIGKVLAVINVVFADISYFWDIFVLLLFYGSALFYDPGKYGPDIQMVMSMNPIYVAVAIARISIIDGMVPKWTLWLKLLIYAFVSYYIGSKIFKKGTQNIVAKL